LTDEPYMDEDEIEEENIGRKRRRREYVFNYIIC
jgi:hypothetical protein